jgi:hypothetical protein
MNDSEQAVVFIDYRDHVKLIPGKQLCQIPKHTVHYTRVAAGRFEGLWR